MPMVEGVLFVRRVGVKPEELTGFVDNGIPRDRPSGPVAESGGDLLDGGFDLVVSHGPSDRGRRKRDLFRRGVTNRSERASAPTFGSHDHRLRVRNVAISSSNISSSAWARAARRRIPRDPMYPGWRASTASTAVRSASSMAMPVSVCCARYCC